MAEVVAVATQAERPPTKKQKKAKHDEMSWRLFPSKIKAFKVGDVVFWKSKSAKELGQRGAVLAAQLPENDRVSVQFGTRQKDVSMKRLTPVLAANRVVVVVPETSHFRNLCSSQVTRDDFVLEIGCSTGEASAILAKYTSHWIGFDTSDEMAAQCGKHAYKVDALMDPTKAIELVQQVLGRQPTKVFVDIGGNRACQGVLRILSFVFTSFPNVNLVAVKSRELAAKISNDLKVEDNCVVLGASKWFKDNLLAGTQLVKHALQAPLRYVPSTNNKQPICRYHNYHEDGCRRGEKCTLDHSHCHVCLQQGHTALECPQQQQQRS